MALTDEAAFPRWQMSGFLVRGHPARHAGAGLSTDWCGPIATGQHRIPALGRCACDLGAIEADNLFVDRFKGQEAVASISNRL